MNYEGRSFVMEELSESSRQQAWNELKSQVCPACNRQKDDFKSFCRRCYFALPEDMKKALYRRFGHGYEEAHEEAREHLKGEALAKSRESANRMMPVPKDEDIPF
jgi:tRNA(Ile2) C34 agmatinyltransferase TiaS